MTDHAETIEKAIFDAAAVGLDQAYQTFASVGRNWVWNEPKRFLKLFHAIPERSPALIGTDRDRFAYGELLRLVAKATNDLTFQLKALEAFELVETPDDFQRQQYAQLLIDMNRPADAIEVLQRIEKPNLFSNYRLSQAKLDVGAEVDALPLIDTSIAALGASTQKYRSAFHEHRFKVRVALGDVGAIDDLHSAIAACKDAKYLRSLNARLAQYLNQNGPT